MNDVHNPTFLASDIPATLADLNRFWDAADPDDLPHFARDIARCIDCRLYLYGESECPVCRNSSNPGIDTGIPMI